MIKTFIILCILKKISFILIIIYYSIIINKTSNNKFLINKFGKKF